MDISFILMTVVIVLSAILAFKVISKIIKFVFLAVLISALIGTGMLFFIKTDMSDLQSSVEKERLFLLENEDGLQAAFSVQFQDREFTEDKGLLKSLILWNPTDFSEDNINQKEIDEYTIEYNNDEFNLLKGEFYAIYLFKFEALDEQNIEDSDETENVEIFRSYLEKNLIADEYFMMKKYKEGVIEVYPKTAVYSMIDYVPSFILKRII